MKKRDLFFLTIANFGLFTILEKKKLFTSSQICEYMVVYMNLNTQQAEISTANLLFHRVNMASLASEFICWKVQETDFSEQRSHKVSAEEIWGIFLTEPQGRSVF